MYIISHLISTAVLLARHYHSFILTDEETKAWQVVSSRRYSQDEDLGKCQVLNTFLATLWVAHCAALWMDASRGLPDLLGDPRQVIHLP